VLEGSSAAEQHYSLDTIFWRSEEEEEMKLKKKKNYPTLISSGVRIYNEGADHQRQYVYM